ncbi:MAG: hypothetical protein H7A23_22095 [Leptospiraceae bacterium]|nr:hypothetical protein [Leptospiraceae bacterium]MCP5497253.1 hypothetical protein [Leptospiraceae bacterium]
MNLLLKTIVFVLVLSLVTFLMFLPVIKSSKVVLKKENDISKQAKINSKTEFIFKKTLELKYHVMSEIEKDWFLRPGRLYIPDFLVPK